MAVVLALLLVVAAGGGAAALVWIGDGAEEGAGTEDRLGEGAAGVTTGDHRPWESYVDLDAVHDVAVAADGSVWTAGAGVHRRAPDGAVQELTLSEDGLPSNRLTSIAVAEGGVVAVGSPRTRIASASGLSVFDGERWTTYTEDDGLASDDVQSVAVSADGTVAAASERQLSLFDGEAWSTYKANDELKPSLGVGINKILSLAADRDGRVWAGTEDGLSVLDEGEWTTYTEDDGLVGEEVNGVAVGDDGTVAAGTSEGLSVSRGGEWKSYTAADGLAGDEVGRVAVGPDGTLAAITSDGLSVRSGGEWTTHAADDGLPATPSVRGRIGPSEPWSVEVDGDGDVWVGHPRGGLSVFDGQQWTTLTTDQGLAHNSVDELVAGPQERVWVATPRGLSVLQDEEWTTLDGPEAGDVSAQALSLAVGDDGTLAMRDRRGRLSVREGGAWATYTVDDGALDGRVRGVEIDKEGTIWAATEAGLAALDAGSWTVYTEEDGLADREVRSVAAGPDGTVWAGTEEGMSAFDGDGWRTYTTEDGLSGDQVGSMAVGEDGTLAARTDRREEGSRETGVSVYDGQEWTSHSFDDRPPLGVAVDADGTVWLGSSEGLIRLDGASRTTYSTRDGLSVNRVRAVDVDENGIVWVGTEVGLSRFDPSADRQAAEPATPDPEGAAKQAETPAPEGDETESLEADEQEAPPSPAGELPPEADDPAIIMARSNHEGGHFQAEIVYQLLVELGFDVAHPEDAELAPASFAQLVDDGEVDLWAHSRSPGYDVLEDAPNARAVGTLVGAGGFSGYLVDKETAEAHDIESIEQIGRDPQLAQLFDSDGDGKAELVGCVQGAGCHEMIDTHLAEEGLDEHISHVWGEGLSARRPQLMRSAILRFEQGQPILFYAWTPSWVLGELVPGEDVVWLEAPTGPAEQDPVDGALVPGGPQACASDPCDIGWTVGDIRIVANEDFLSQEPAAARLLEQIELTALEISRQNAKMHQGEGSRDDIERHAREWIEKNRGVVDGWLENARAAGS